MFGSGVREAWDVGCEAAAQGAGFFERLLSPASYSCGQASLSFRF